MEEQIRKVHNVESMEDLTPKMWWDVVMRQAGDLMSTPEAKDWTFGGYKRGPDGRFDDAELAKLIVSCVEEPAHAFGAHGTPDSLRMVDILGMKQAREKFNVCTMNE